jgi:lipopolysaccharide biosynthesis glycosyltransferase
MTQSPLTSPEFHSIPREPRCNLEPIAQRQYQVEIETTSNEEAVSTSRQLLAGFGIEFPTTGTHEGIQKLIIKGWVIAHKSKPLIIEVNYQDKVIARTSVNKWRPDINSNIPGLPSVEYCGYGTILPLQNFPEQGEITIDTVLSDGSRINLGKFTIKIIDLGLILFRKKCQLSICAILKNEAQYIIEWLEFHKIVGVERFYLYDNNSTDNLIDIITPYIESGEVILHEWSSTYIPQIFAYAHCISAHSDESEWIAFIDLDEFLAPTEKDDLKIVLDEFKGVGGVAINQFFFGSSGHQTRPDGLQIENYTKRGSDTYHGNTYVKLIARPNNILMMESPHHCSTLNPEIFVVTENHEFLLGGQTQSVSAQKLRLHHYYTRSQQEMVRKSQKGDAIFPGGKHLPSLQKTDSLINEIEDLSFQRFVPQVKQVVNRIISNSKVYQILEEKWQLETELYQREYELNQVQVRLNQSQVGWYREYWKRSNFPTLSLLNQPTIKWFFAINDEGQGFEFYAQMMKVSVLTAKQNTRLEPYCIYDGQENELTEWLRKNGVTVIHYRSLHYDQFKRDIPDAAHVAAGAFLRIEIPKIVQKYGMQDEYVLYTDCDTMFQNDVVDYLKGVTCEYIAAAPEFDPNNWSYLNSGVLYMNIKNLLKIDQEFNNFIMYNLMEVMKGAFDQGAYNLFFQDRWQHLDPALNWKSYWDLNPNTKVIHFHGPKPNQGVHPHLESLANQNYWENVEIWKDKYHAVELFSGDSLDKCMTEQHRESEVICQELARIKAELHQRKEELERSQSQFDEVLAELEEAHGQLHQRQSSQTDLSV